MSFCHPERGEFSCGACCGLFNLELDLNNYRKLLKERTEKFEESIQFSKPWTIAVYRKEREELESNLIKRDNTIYNCPFLGYTDIGEKKIGCMIHPVRSGDPKSQNFSFYGTSICQGYTCKNFERDRDGFWENLFLEISKDSIEYSRLSSDHITINLLEKIIGKEKLNQSRSLIIKILNYKLETKKENLTSFEIDMNDGNEDPIKLLKERLNINLNLLAELENIKE